jgi:hypothetical protein
VKKPKGPKKAFEPDPDIGRPCGICGAIYRYRITLRCTACKKKVVYECSSPGEAIAMEQQLASGATHAKCDNAKMRIRRWRTHEHHHISYKNDVTVLVCYQCHQRMHGNAVITSHPFKKEYGKDIEPFVFAAHVTQLYVERMPELTYDEPEPAERELTKVEKRLNTTSH